MRAEPVVHARRSKTASVSVIVDAQVGAVALWFFVSAVLPSLVAEFGLSGFMRVALTGSVQASLVAGCLAGAAPWLAGPWRILADSALAGGRR